MKDPEDERVHFNVEHHMLIEDAKKILKQSEMFKDDKDIL